jgi:predicted small integral membrane protein
VNPARIASFVVGAAVVAATLGSAIRTVILPRGIPAKLGRFVFISMRALYRLRARPSASYERRDRVMALYAPVSLLVLLLTWMTVVLLGYTGMFWGLTHRSLRSAFRLSGSSILTLGFQTADDLPSTILVFTEAALGLILLALLITYLPSIYGSFSRREAAVTALEVRAGSPPSGTEMIWRYHALERTDRLIEVWKAWETWFVEVEESHTSLPSLVFFRSPQPDHSWVTAAGAVLDGASLSLSSVEIPREVQAEFCIRAGYLALRRIADFFGIPYDPAPKRHDPIAITRHEYDQACDWLASEGVPLKPDREQAWRDFAGWRVNYDTVLIALAGLTMAPYAQWSSDRSLRTWRPPLLPGRARRRSPGPAVLYASESIPDRSEPGGTGS